MFLCSELGVGLSLIISTEIVVMVWSPTPAAGRISAGVPLRSGGEWSVDYDRLLSLSFLERVASVRSKDPMEVR
jgi:hypothetical protein